MRIKRRRKLIPRFSLPIYHRKKIESGDTDSPFDNVVVDTWVCLCEEGKYCTLQVPNKKSIDIDLTGISSQEMFLLFTATPMHEAEEGTNFLGSGVYIPDSYFQYTDGDASSSSVVIPSKGGWYNVVSSKYRGVGVQSHYEVLVVKDNDALDDEYPILQREDCASLWSTYELFKGGTGWVSNWIGTETISEDGTHTQSDTVDDTTDNSWDSVG